MSGQQTCATCQFWLAPPSAYYGDCALRVYYGRPPCNYAGCIYHSELGKAPAEVSQQSACRGMTVQEWHRRMGIK